MINAFARFGAVSRWLTGALILLLPVSLIFWLGSQMAYGQVKGKFEAYAEIPEVTGLAQLEKLPAGQVVLLRGRLAGSGPGSELLVFRERPAGGREVRFQEEFPQHFPEFILELPDGPVLISPSQTQKPIIQHEPHTLPWGDREHSGFRPGDTVTVQGQWQPAGQPLLAEVTGISSQAKAGLLAEWQAAFRQLQWARNGLGLLTLLSLGALGVQLRRARQPQTTRRTRSDLGTNLEQT